MIPNTPLGLVLFLAALGPGYVYIRIAEQRRPRPDRSGLLEAVELAVIGALASTAALLAVLPIAGLISATSISKLARDPSAYIHANPVTAVGLTAVVLAVACALAYALATLVHRKDAANVRPGGTSWYDAFWANRPGQEDVVIVTLELRDHRKITGKLRSFTVGLEENREIGLAAPIATQAGPGSSPALGGDGFVVVREADVLSVSGHYVAGRKPAPDRDRRQLRGLGERYRQRQR